MFWLNSMCFDVWRSFRLLRDHSRRTRLPALTWRHPKFKWYALWAWGGPAVVVGVTLAMQYLPPSYTRGAKLPGVGLEGTCFLGSEGALYYLHMINLPILMSNIVLFTLRYTNSSDCIML